jgi:hypothetical protein
MSPWLTPTKHSRNIRKHSHPENNHYQHINKEEEGIRYHHAAGYDGPWIENIWIDYFYNNKSVQDLSCLMNEYGGMIPLFIPWTDLWEPEW